MLPVKICSLLMIVMISACSKVDNSPMTNEFGVPYRATRQVSYGGVEVGVVISKSKENNVDVLMVYHGTSGSDSKILEAANQTLDGFDRILDRSDMMIVSVVYPEDNLLMGDNVVHAEAALLWMKNHGEKELGIKIGKIFLAGHSQGGYIVTRLNTMHATDGVIANAPGPLNMVFRCQLEEDGKIASGIHCTALKNKYGTTAQNPDAYFQRSLLNFTEGFKSDILFVQGMDDSPIQMYSWPVFRDKVKACNSCRGVEVFEIPGFGHPSLFESADGKTVFNDFILRH